MLPRALRGHHVHHQHAAAHPLLLLQPDRALRPHLQHGAARLHAAARRGREAHTRSVDASTDDDITPLSHGRLTSCLEFNIYLLFSET